MLPAIGRTFLEHMHKKIYDVHAEAVGSAGQQVCQVPAPGVPSGV